MSPGFLAAFGYMMWTGCLDCCGGVSFHCQQYFLCWGLIFFFPQLVQLSFSCTTFFALTLIFLHFFSAEKEWSVLQLHHRKNCNCMCKLLWMIVLSKDHCSESWGHVHQTSERKRLTHGQFSFYPNYEHHFFPLYNPKNIVLDLCSQKIILCLYEQQQADNLVCACQQIKDLIVVFRSQAEKLWWSSSGTAVLDNLKCTHATDVIREKWHVTGSLTFCEHLINNFYLNHCLRTVCSK